MAMSYLNYLKAKAHISTAEKSENPVLSDEDEAFLKRIASEEGDATPPPLPARPITGANSNTSSKTVSQVDVTGLPVAGETKGNDAQLALFDGAQNIELPATPAEEDVKDGLGEAEDVAKEVPLPAETPAEEKGGLLGEGVKAEEEKKGKEKEKKKDKKGKGKEKAAEVKEEVSAKAKSRWSFFRRKSRAENTTGTPATDPNDPNVPVSPHEAKEEEEDMTVILERLNLAAINNRVFSISDETKDLLQKFNLVFKDLVNGVPTAYDDLESLLTNGDKTLQKTYNNLPSFLQKLVQTLPDKVTKGLAPEVLAVAAEKASATGLNMENAGKAAGTAKKFGFKAPELKDLIGKPGAVAGMFRSILTFLRARFPAFMGLNVLWSLAMFLILLVLWYCHKRGREARLEQERTLTEAEVRQLEAEWAALEAVRSAAGQAPQAHPQGGVYRTTAPEGASMDQIREGILEAEEARRQAEIAERGGGEGELGLSGEASAASLGTTVQPAEAVGTKVEEKK